MPRWICREQWYKLTEQYGLASVRRMDKDYFKGKTVLVMGLGRFGGGVDSAVFAHQAGASVIVTDLADETALTGPLGQLRKFGGIEYHLGGHRETDFDASGNTDIVIVNPAVPPDNRFIEIARKAGKMITSQIEILFQLSPAPIVGITGSNGKSTTTALTAHLLGAGKPPAGYNKVHLGGNIGNKPLLGRIAEIGPSDIVVLELSSFQLEQLERIGKGPSIAVVTNVTPNHLDRHGTFESYCRAKENIFRLQELNGASEAVSIFNAEDAVAMEWFSRYRNQKGRRCITFSADDVPDDVRGAFRLRGRFNLSNLSAAIAVALRFGVSTAQIKEALATFTGLDHRLQLIAEIDGASWYNDSIATTPASTIAALEAFDQPKILIAGGYDKGLAFDELGRCIARRARAAVLIGATAGKIAEAIASAGESKVRVTTADSLAQAVTAAQKIADPGDVVLLSPACASYDMFDNFQQRGDRFAELATALKTAE